MRLVSIHPTFVTPKAHSLRQRFLQTQILRALGVVPCLKVSINVRHAILTNRISSLLYTQKSAVKNAMSPLSSILVLQQMKRIQHCATNAVRRVHLAMLVTVLASVMTMGRSDGGWKFENAQSVVTGVDILMRLRLGAIPSDVSPRIVLAAG